MNTKRSLRIVWFSCSGAPFGAEILQRIRESDSVVLNEIVAVVLSRPKSGNTPSNVLTDANKKISFLRSFPARVISGIGWRINIAIDILRRKSRSALSIVSYQRYKTIEDFCVDHGIDTYITRNVNNEETETYLRGLKADLFIVTTFHHILKPSIFLLPRIATLNIHPSYLPEFRGADPINEALKNQVAQTGVTIHWIDEGIDTGEIVEQRRLEIGDAKTEAQLRPKLSRIAAELLLDCVERVRKGELSQNGGSGHL